MQYESSLQHWGIKGMKWGVRRFQAKDGSLTSAGRKRYKATKTDEATFGKKGAQRIANRRNKGDSRQKAVAKEVGVQVGKTVALSAAIGAAGIIYNNDLYEDIPKTLSSLGKRAINTYLNAAVVDNSGKVLYRYRNAVNVGRRVLDNIQQFRR